MSIVFIAPEHEIFEAYKRVLSDVGDKVQVIEAIMGKAVMMARKLEEKGAADVFVSRGGTALMLRSQGIRSPIVEIHLTSGDMVHALSKARSVTHVENPSIAVVAFPNMVQNLLDFEPFLNLRLSCYRLSSEEEAQSLVEKAVSEGAQVVLGGAISTRIARKLGVQTILLRTGEASIRLAFDEAQRIVYARRLEAQRGNELKAILDYAYEGVVAVNSAGKITVFNPVAQNLINLPQERVLGHPSDEIIPAIGLSDVLEKGYEGTGEIVDLGRSKVMVNRIPIRVGGEIVGAVATFQDVTRIQSMEARIRREIYSQGHVARFSLADIRGRSPVMASTIATANQYARVDSTVLIHGETGVGKELFAQGIHCASSRANGPFVAVNCAALPENLLESELFGYVEGAFTGAVRKGKPGLFELAHHGTIFLDEVSEIPLSLQGRLLRVLQEREVVRLGHDRVIQVDVRVLCATNREIHRLADEGTFRQDLYWRLNVLSLTIPPLRERPADIPLLLNHFLLSPSGGRKRNQLTADAIDFLIRHRWPGNVRELKNFCERLMAAPIEDEIDEGFTKQLLEYRAPVPPLCTGREDHEDIKRALEAVGGNLGRAARLLGIHRATLWRRRKRMLSARTG